VSFAIGGVLGLHHGADGPDESYKLSSNGSDHGASVFLTVGHSREFLVQAFPEPSMQFEPRRRVA
jgi:hypothetical protein